MKNNISDISLENKRKNAKEIIKLLKRQYGNEPICHLKAKNDYQFLFAVMLSAQATDKKVNMITPILFDKYKSLKDFANADIKDIENIIYEIGFYHNKAISLKLCAMQLLKEHGGKVPKTYDELIKLRGVGNKTANVVLGHLFNEKALAVDTHVNRISNKLFTLNEKNPDKVEELLKNIIDKRYYVLWNTHIISFGREICSAKRPKCEICFLKKYCEYYINNTGRYE